MKRMLRILIFCAGIGYCSSALPEDTAGIEDVRATSPDVKLEDMHPERDANTKPITFYCCDKTGKTTCTVNAPGPVGEPCFCPGVIPAGTLCMPH